MAAYSYDLRQRVLDAALLGDATEQAVADRFGVSRSFVQKMKRLYRETGALDPSRAPRGPRPKLSQADLAALAAWVVQEPALTGSQLAARLARERGVSVSRATVNKALQKSDLRRSSIEERGRDKTDAERPSRDGSAPANDDLDDADPPRASPRRKPWAPGVQSGGPRRGRGSQRGADGARSGASQRGLRVRVDEPRPPTTGPRRAPRPISLHAPRQRSETRASLTSCPASVALAEGPGAAAGSGGGTRSGQPVSNGKRVKHTRVEHVTRLERPLYEFVESRHIPH